MSRVLALFAVLAVLGGCTEANGGNPAFRASGELVALSGGDGGVRHACITCHGLNGEGDGRLSPRLAGLDAGYLYRALDDYVTGRRTHAEMRTIARRLTVTDRANVAAYYASLPSTGEPWTEVSALYRDRCAECHGANGEGAGPANPPLAGQSPAYIEAQLNAWRTGHRRDPLGVMADISRALTPEQIRHLAGHAAPLPPDPPQAGAASR